ncbi:Flp pilus assembly protein TadB [Actinobaculum suis]|uniref:Flp pilus assembly protein TadB n=1 Tax=Actinobaculum suis TaxID=1657 RepID=A0A7Z8Y7K8_9ACTO|nr:hypothetical protein [Actinobaculum suis]VDG75626.1 Flp pilus assembly protein TadB [Actinobaculum suis]
MIFLACALLLLAAVYTRRAPRAGTRPALLAQSQRNRERRAAQKARRAKEKSARKAARTTDIGMLAAEAAARMRSGATTENAWRLTVAREGFSVPAGGELDATGVPRALRMIWETASRRRKRKDVSLYGIPPVIAVCRLSHLTGASAADVLEACAQGITEAAEAAGERQIALAGPLSSARILACLPIFGIFLGIVFGANPLGFLFGSPFGLVCLVLAIIFEGTGIWWTRRLVRQAGMGQ